MVPPLPWVYPYEEDGPRLDSIVLRPVVPITVVGTDVSVPVLALVDSGCSHVVFAPWVAVVAGVDPKSSDREISLGLGGDTVRVRFLDVTLRLHPPGDNDDDSYIEWQDEVGFLDRWRPTWPAIVGQSGFFKRFTVTMSRLAQAVAVDDQDMFDRRYETPIVR